MFSYNVQFLFAPNFHFSGFDYVTPTLFSHAKFLQVMIVFTFYNAATTSGSSCTIFVRHFVDSRFDFTRF